MIVRDQYGRSRSVNGPVVPGSWTCDTDGIPFLAADDYHPAADDYHPNVPDNFSTSFKLWFFFFKFLPPIIAFANGFMLFDFLAAMFLYWEGVWILLSMIVTGLVFATISRFSPRIAFLNVLLFPLFVMYLHAS